MSWHLIFYSNTLTIGRFNVFMDTGFNNMKCVPFIHKTGHKECSCSVLVTEFYNNSITEFFKYSMSLRKRVRSCGAALGTWCTVLKHTLQWGAAPVCRIHDLANQVISHYHHAGTVNWRLASIQLRSRSHLSETWIISYPLTISWLSFADRNFLDLLRLICVGCRWNTIRYNEVENLTENWIEMPAISYCNRLATT
jgi:hypothetical protein